MTIHNLRKKLEKIDYQLVKLLDERIELLLKWKRAEGSTLISAEAEMPRQITPLVRGILDAAFFQRLYNEINREGEKILAQDFQLIAFQGEHGAYSEMAARIWNEDWIPIPSLNFTELFEGVEAGIYDFAIVPVENNTGGVVNQVNQLILKSPLHVVGAVEMVIHHCLLAPRGADYRELHAIYSHTQALEQCRQFLARNKLQPIPYYDTAGAARMIAEEEPPSAGAIASKLAAELYNLEIIKENIEDFEKNITRFLVFSRKPNEEKGDKCSIIFSTAHKAGTLFRVLEVFARHGINLTRIESMPDLQGNFAFFLDFEGDKSEPVVAETLEEVKKITTKFRLLGCYTEKKSE